MAAPPPSQTTARPASTKAIGMLRRTPTGSKITTVPTGVSANRKCASWIESFIESTSALDTPAIFRKWAAISTIAAAVEQRVCMVTGKGALYPNVYCMLIAHPGVGKTATIRRARQYYLETQEPLLAPTSLTGAAM